jgi:transcriptional regulator with XRE-family HTH domain
MPLDISEIRRENLRRLRGDARGSQSALARLLGMEEAQMSQLVGKNPSKAIGGRLARTIERKLKLERGWMDSEHYPATRGNAHIIKAIEGLSTDQQMAVLNLIASMKK